MQSTPVRRQRRFLLGEWLSYVRPEEYQGPSLRRMVRRWLMLRALLAGLMLLRVPAATTPTYRPCSVTLRVERSPSPMIRAHAMKRGAGWKRTVEVLTPSSTSGGSWLVKRRRRERTVRSSRRTFTKCISATNVLRANVGNGSFRGVGCKCPKSGGSQGGSVSHKTGEGGACPTKQAGVRKMCARQGGGRLP